LAGGQWAADVLLSAASFRFSNTSTVLLQPPDRRAVGLNARGDSHLFVPRAGSPGCARIHVGLRATPSTADVGGQTGACALGGCTAAPAGGRSRDRRPDSDSHRGTPAAVAIARAPPGAVDLLLTITALHRQCRAVSRGRCGSHAGAASHGARRRRLLRTRPDPWGASGRLRSRLPYDTCVLMKVGAHARCRPRWRGPLADTPPAVGASQRLPGCGPGRVMAGNGAATASAAVTNRKGALSAVRARPLCRKV
jgi:hypothetical protein